MTLCPTIKDDQDLTGFIQLPHKTYMRRLAFIYHAKLQRDSTIVTFDDR
jgi:hypothetical protein